MEVHPDWAPLGAARMKTLVDEQFFSGVRFFRVINNFMAQFGISGDQKSRLNGATKRWWTIPSRKATRGALCHLQHRARILALLRFAPSVRPGVVPLDAL
jgi:cyclophilin family peptidyl-prolyl cis-trans isomerase